MASQCKAYSMPLKYPLVVLVVIHETVWYPTGLASCMMMNTYYQSKTSSAAFYGHFLHLQLHVSTELTLSKTTEMIVPVQCLSRYLHSNNKK